MPGALPRREIGRAASRLWTALVNAIEESRTPSTSHVGAREVQAGMDAARARLIARQSDQALLERAAAQGYEPVRPLGYAPPPLNDLNRTMYHGPRWPTERWVENAAPAWHVGPLPIQRVDIRRTDLGLHAGSPRAAEQAGLVSALRGARPEAHVLVARRGGRPLIIEGDLGGWRSLHTFEREARLYPERFVNLDRQELEALRQAMKRVMEGSEYYNANMQPGLGAVTRLTRRFLRDHGFDRVVYRNNSEDAGNISVAFLNPWLVRDLSRAKFAWPQWGRNSLLYGTGAGALTAASLDDDI